MNVASRTRSRPRPTQFQSQDELGRASVEMPCKTRLGAHCCASHAVKVQLAKRQLVADPLSGMGPTPCAGEAHHSLACLGRCFFASDSEAVNRDFHRSLLKKVKLERGKCSPRRWLSNCPCTRPSLALVFLVCTAPPTELIPPPCSWPREQLGMPSHHPSQSLARKRKKKKKESNPA